MTSIADQLMERRASLIIKAQEIAQKGVVEGRNLTVEEQTSFDQMIAEAGEIHDRAKAIHDGEQRGKELDERFQKQTGNEKREATQESGLGKWAREARIGDAFDVAPVNGAAQRAIATRGKGAGVESRALSATGGVGADGVYGQLWQYAVAGSQILQAGVDIINTTDGNSLPLPVATVHSTVAGGNSPTATAANAALTASDATLTTVALNVSKYGYLTLVPSELVADTTFDLEGYLAQSAGRELSRVVSAVAASAAIAGFTTAGVTGTAGTGNGSGFGTVTTVGQGADVIYNLFHSVLPEYRPMAAFVMADPTAGLIRTLKSTTGSPLWQPAMTAGDPDLLVGKPTYQAPQFDTATASSAKKILYFGEWSALKVRFAGGIRFERSNDYAFGNDQIAYRAVVRCGAAVVDPNAVKYYVTAAT